MSIVLLSAEGSSSPEGGSGDTPSHVDDHVPLTNDDTLITIPVDLCHQLWRMGILADG
jgi:hypothetical protein